MFFCFKIVYKQVKGTAMGVCFASNYANLFLGLWEERYFSTHNSSFWIKSFSGVDILMMSH